MMGSAEVCADGDQDQTHFIEATSLVFNMSLFLCFCFISALNNLWLPGPHSALISLSTVLMSFPGRECIPVVEQLAAGAQHGACPRPSIRGKHKWLHRQPRPAANTQTVLGQEFCFAKDLQNTTGLFSFEFLHSPWI